MPQPNSAAASPAGRWPITRSTGAPSGAAWAAPTLGAQLRVVDDDGNPLAPDQAGPARGQTRSAGPVGGLDADHGHGPHRRRRLPVDPGSRRPGDHPRRLQGDARRRARRAGEPSRRAGRGRGRQARRPPRRNTRRDGRAAGRRSRRRRRAAGVPAKPAGALRDSHRDRDRRRDPPNTVRQARSDAVIRGGMPRTR